MNRRTPVALFTYNRPEHAARVLETLAACRRREECEFHFFSDGPKSEAHTAKVAETRAVLREWAPRLGAVVVERAENLGLARSIAGSVAELCASHGRVIVVEDDLLLGADFLHFMLSALDRYADDEGVMQVGGCTLSPPPDAEADAFLLPVTTTWGWATWARAWRHFSWQPQDLSVARTDAPWRELFDLDGAGGFTRMLEDRLAGRNDSWGILWWYAVSRRRGLVVYPARSLVINGGFDGSGTHCGDGDLPGVSDGSLRDAPPLPDAPSFPAATVDRPEDLVALRRFLGAQTGSGAAPGRSSGFLRGLLAKFGKGLRDAVH